LIEEKIKRDRAEGYKKVAMQAKPELWSRVKIAAGLEERDIYLLVNDAIEQYLKKYYPNLCIEDMRRKAE